MPLSGHEQAAFAAIIAKLGDPERRRLRRMTAYLSAIVLLLVGAVSRFFHWPWAVCIAFCTTFVVAVGVGLALHTDRSDIKQCVLRCIRA